VNYLGRTCANIRNLVSAVFLIMQVLPHRLVDSQPAEKHLIWYSNDSVGSDRDPVINWILGLCLPMIS